MDSEKPRDPEEVLAERVVVFTYCGCFVAFMASVSVCLWAVLKLVQWVVS